ncbi:DUF4250 domain-containing protein [Lachnoclostridium phytofermentans]|uniref:DUF4250 domain-containing protein n=1 Tax=Lachnoclostridium phytofermentans (strain ATCC 700394 / DSM 18823 / ISDg) TaxID=357809 RepID=A9KI54_LACP7|nr:DUF4250 domain-containing protein [Lachnoclostridium phytofermentans]ABX40888.1 conserved hypothetical protein [Lachnoclostridium phytofermentans ISDg]
MLPTDPIMLLSYVNTKLRDEFQSLEDFCQSLDVNVVTLIDTLDKIDYHYSKERNQFI